MSKSPIDHCRNFENEHLLSSRIYPKETFYSEKLGTHHPLPRRTIIPQKRHQQLSRKLDSNTRTRSLRARPIKVRQSDGPIRRMRCRTISRIGSPIDNSKLPFLLEQGQKISKGLPRILTSYLIRSTAMKRLQRSLCLFYVF